MQDPMATLFLVFCLFVCFLRYAGLSLPWPLPLPSTGSGCAGSAGMAYGPSRSAACGIFPGRGTNPCPLHQQADSQPLRHQGSPIFWCFVPPPPPYAGLSLFGLSRGGASAPDAQAQWPWLTGPAALRHVGSSRAGARTRVPCIGRRTLNHCTTREALVGVF